MRRKLARYVPNASLDRAQEILDERHICIISGIPGIGKTTLAEILVTHLVDRNGFTPFRISNRLDEIKSLKDRSKRQGFYFDDFLGRTSLIRLERNEDRELLDLMRQVAENDRWRLVLTTREYILSAAKKSYEAIHNIPYGFAKCIIDLSDYTLSVRAQILYNHIHFSDLPKPHKLALLDDFNYRKIIDHKNFIPRLIEWMTGDFYMHRTDAKEHLNDLQTNLDDPIRIWEHAFMHQIGRASHHLILILATLPWRVYEEDARICFVSFRNYRRSKYGEVLHANDWDEALRELDGSFLATVKVGRHVALQFHNPSVEDFVKAHMRRTPADVDDLLASAVFFEQYSKLWLAHEGRLKLLDSAFMKLTDFIPGQGVRTVVTDAGLLVVAAVEEQVRFLMRVAKRTGRSVSKSAESKVRSLANRWQVGEGDRAACLSLLLDWKQEMGRVSEVVIGAAKSLMLDSEYLDDFDTSASFIEAFPSVLSEEELELLAGRFDADLWELCDGQSVDDLSEVIEIVEHVGDVLGVDVGYVVERLNENIEKLEWKERERVGYRAAKWEREKETTYEMGGIDAMFASLRDWVANS